ncbi:MAG: hypothetical protein GY845_31380 [Planctomycetes bacterium]|nr:hypothetical protein [Planctomycetota bacterium]
MSLELSGKPDAWKLARPVWGWGRGVILRPTPQVEWNNLASQGYLECDMGKLKVNATFELSWRINAATQIQAVPECFRRSMDVGNTVFCAVDRIDTRRLIWDSVSDVVQ